ncbi:MAG: hypothetical protein ACI3ZT_04450 [Candidatus Cryptobacteroides sp.]
MKLNIKISILMAVSAMLALVSCTADEKDIPTKDSSPAVTVYTYGPGDDYNEDNDIRVRLVANDATSEVYYLAQPAEQADAYREANGEEAYFEYVVKNGTKAELGNGDPDFTLTDLYGLYDITAVAVGKGKTSGGLAEFFGLSWEPYKKGVYYFSVLASKVGLQSAETELQKCTSDETLYRFTNLFGPGKNMKINLLPDYTYEDDGTYTFFRIAPQRTGLTYGNYGEISVRDIGYWQNNDAFITDGGYESAMHESGYCYICAQYYVSVGSIGFNWDEFYPEE